MAKKKYYAVRVGRKPGVYNTWDECQEQTKGVSGAVFQAFSSLESAEQFLLVDTNDSANTTDTAVEDYNAQIQIAISNLNEDTIVAFVDGSYDTTATKSAFGAIIFSNGGRKDVLYKAFTEQLDPDFIALRNVAAELEGVKEVVNWAIQYGKTKVTIYYDYTGIEKWANGEWKAKNPITKQYTQFITEKRTTLEIEFKKVPAHSDVELNEEVDKIAKKALLAKGHKTYNDGSVYFVEYGVEDWETIIQCINDENAHLPEAISSISVTKSLIGTRTKITIRQGSNAVVINCYNNNNSYVQGKQTVLFQKIIASAIELMTNSQSVVETLNCYHALTLTKTEVENRFTELLPNYKHDTQKHYANLLSAVFNTMLTGYMPDYTCLMTPIFRAFEYYLHRILGDVMGLDTENDSGKNVFSYFSKNAAGLYECNNPSKNTLSPAQLDFLNRLYTRYNSIRHPYSHWSACDSETSVTADIKIARTHLLEGLALIDQYYVHY